MRSRAALGALGSISAAALVMVATACGLPTGESSFDTIDAEDVPTGLNEPSTTTTSTTTTSTTMPEIPVSTVETTTTSTSSTLPTVLVQVYFISRGSLERVDRELPSGFGANQLVAILEEGPPPGSLGAALESFVREGLIVGQPVAEFGVINVTLDPDRFDQIPARDQREALAQIVLTLLSNTTGVGQVSFLLDDEPLPIPTDSGSRLTASVQDFDRLLGAPVPVGEPVDTVDTVDTVDGTVPNLTTTIA